MIHAGEQNVKVFVSAAVAAGRFACHSNGGGQGILRTPLKHPVTESAGCGILCDLWISVGMNVYVNYHLYNRSFPIQIRASFAESSAYRLVRIKHSDDLGGQICAFFLAFGDGFSCHNSMHKACQEGVARPNSVDDLFRWGNARAVKFFSVPNQRAVFAEGGNDQRGPRL